MAIIKAFKAIRPAKDKAPFLASRSYEDYTVKELNAILTYNPFSFLHIINPGFKFDKKVSGGERLRLIRNRYLEFLEDEILIRDTQPSFYLYKIEKEDFSCCGLFCGTSVEDYKNNVIKKHEDTIKHRENLFAVYLKNVSFNAEPVLLTYPDNPTIGEIIGEVKNRDPEYRFSTTDKATHTLWTITKEEEISKLQDEFSKIDSLYIADGHHRSASSMIFADKSKKGNPEHTGMEPYNYFMSYLIPESEIKIFEFNRLVKDLNGLTKEEFLIELDTYFKIEKKGNALYKPLEKHQFSMYLDGDFYALQLRKQIFKFTDALSRLDTQILYKTILEPILGISDLRKDKRIKYGFGKNNIFNMKDEIDKGNFMVGFGMVPVSINELKDIADAGLVMPPKSTYIEPKIRSGLTIYEL